MDEITLLIIVLGVVLFVDGISRRIVKAVYPSRFKLISIGWWASAALGIILIVAGTISWLRS